jgi:hypothetical protein
MNARYDKVKEINNKDANLPKVISRFATFKDVKLDVNEWVTYVDGVKIENYIDEVTGLRKGNFEREWHRASPKMQMSKNKCARQNVKYLLVPDEDIESISPEARGNDGIDFNRDLIVVTVREGEEDVKIRYKRYLKEVPSEKEYLAEFGIESFHDFEYNEIDCDSLEEIVDEFEGLEYGEWSWDNE